MLDCWTAGLCSACICHNATRRVHPIEVGRFGRSQLHAHVMAHMCMHVLVHAQTRARTHARMCTQLYEIGDDLSAGHILATASEMGSTCLHSFLYACLLLHTCLYICLYTYLAAYHATYDAYDGTYNCNIQRNTTADGDWWLEGGSLVGALRKPHEFIPWDSDADMRGQFCAAPKHLKALAPVGLEADASVTL